MRALSNQQDDDQQLAKFEQYKLDLKKSREQRHSKMNAMQFLRQGGTQIFDGSMQANSFNQADESDKNQESDDENYGDEGSEDNECDVDDSSCMSSGENDDSRHNNATIDDEDEGEQTISIQP